MYSTIESRQNWSSIIVIWKNSTQSQEECASEIDEYDEIFSNAIAKGLLKWIFSHKNMDSFDAMKQASVKIAALLQYSSLLAVQQL